MEIFYNDWFLFYILPMLLHLVATWYSHDLFSSEYVNALIEKENLTKEDLTSITKFSVIISFIPLFNIVSCLHFIFCFVMDWINDTIRFFKKD